VIAGRTDPPLPIARLRARGELTELRAAQLRFAPDEVVVLTRPSTAERAGHDVVAVIRGTAVGQDGDSAGLTVPNGTAQTEVMRKALEAARLTPADIQYVEAHGTGTRSATRSRWAPSTTSSPSRGRYRSAPSRPAQPPPPAPEGEQLFTLSAKGVPALRAQACAYLRFLEHHPEVDLARLCHAVTVQRSHHGHRLAAVVRDRSELTAALIAAQAPTEPPARSAIRKAPERGSLRR
jgi:acyl transferase domain-containing protein